MYQNLPKEKKNKKRWYGREQYRNLLEYGKQRLVEYKKNCSRFQKQYIDLFILLLMITGHCIK